MACANNALNFLDGKICTLQELSIITMMMVMVVAVTTSKVKAMETTRAVIVV